MELKHSVSSNGSNLLEEVLPASHFGAALSLGAHAWLLLWTAWLSSVTVSALRLTADPPCHARNFNKSLFTVFQLFLKIPASGKFFTVEIWFWYWTKSSFTPSPSSSCYSFENQVFLQDGNLGLVTVLSQNYPEFWQRTVISRLPLEL